MGQGVGLFEVVGGEENGLSLGGQASDLLPEGAAGFDIHADSGLVEEDEVGVAADGEGEEDALLLAAAELAEEAVFDALELRDAEDVGDGEWVGIVAAEEVEVLADAEGFGDAGDLQHGADAGASGGFARVAAEDLRGAGGGGDEAEEQLDGGGFAGAVGAEQSDDFAGTEREAQVVEGDGCAVALGDVGQRGDGFAAGTTSGCLCVDSVPSRRRLRSAA